MNSKNLLAALSIESIHTGLIKMYLDSRGKILGPTEEPGWKIAPMIWNELVSAGNVGCFFDLSATLPLDKIPIWDPDKRTSKPPFFSNRKAFFYLPDPDQFYTSLPSMVLTIFRPEKSVFVGIIRQLKNLPNITIGGSGCIVYVDSRDRLAGFTEGLLDLIDSRPADPTTLLGQPVDRFFTPSPAKLRKQHLSLDPLRSRSEFRTQYAISFAQQDLGETHCSRPQSLTRTPQGLLCRNDTENFIYLTLPVSVDTHKDFLFTTDITVNRGLKPSVFLTRQPDPKLYTVNTPDAEGYQLGIRPDLGKFTVKRKAMIQLVGSPTSANNQAIFECFKIGNTLRLLENRKCMIEYADFSFIHHERARVVLGFRAGSECLLRHLHLAVAEPARPPETDIVPIVRFRAAAPQSALLTRIDNTSLVANNPEVTAWVLENITHLETQMARLKRDNERLRQAVGAQTGDFIGKSRAMVKVKANAAKVAATNATVLLQGPTGSGKEVLARYIHERSPRKEMPFVKVDCSVISPALMESELFGHEKGAFTGAHERHIGRFEQARGGTVFLDEAGSLSLEAQAKLLHFLQDRVVTRVGGRETIQLDVRVIVASNIPLADLVRKGTFREDLFFRIDVVTINLPGLSERLDDLAELCAHFVEECNGQHKKAIRGLTPAAHRKIAGYAWPGNVRELRNTIERAVLFCATDRIDAQDIVFSLESGKHYAGNRGNYRREFVPLDKIRQAIRENRGNLKAAAAGLNLPRRTLYNHLKKNGLSPAQSRGQGQGFSTGQASP